MTRYVRPYSPATGLPAASGDWIDENVEDGIEGSIPPAAFYREIQGTVNNVIVGAGLALDASTDETPDLNQLLVAVEMIHRFREDTTLFVPAQFSTIHEAIDYCANKIIGRDVTVTISVAAGDYAVNTETGAIHIDNPFGHRVQLLGAALVGSFPSFANVDNALHSTVEATLRTIFPTRITIQGNVNGVFMQGGSLKSMERFLVIGDNTDQQHGFICGQWVNQYGWGNILFRDMWFHRCGEDGLRMNYNSACIATRVGASHCGNAGVRVANVSNMTVTDTLISARNATAGVAVLDGSLFEVFGGSMTSSRNGAWGLLAGDNSQCTLSGAGSIIIQNNYGGAGVGLQCQGARVSLPSGTTMGSNGTDLTADSGGYIFAPASIAGLTLSPAANTVGNHNSYIRRT